jgi:Domain of unknown function (DUF6259)
MSSTEMVRLENLVLAAELDPQTGALRSLLGKETGWQVQRRPELARSFHLMVPLPDRRHHMIDGLAQSPPEIEISDNGRRVRMVWRGLEGPLAGQLDITFEQTVTLDDTGLRYECRVQNDSQHTVENVTTPCLGDLSMPAADEPLSLMFPGYAGMTTRGLLPHFVGEGGYYGTDWPFQMASYYPESPFILAASLRQGLYVGCHDVDAREAVRFAFWLKPGLETSRSVSSGLASPTGEIDGKPNHLEMEVWHFPYAAPGETVELAPIVVSPYAGQWTRGVDRYKEWRKTWHRPPQTPDWARDIHAWQQLHINSPEDELRCRYADLVRYGEDCARHGIAAIQLVGWNNGGQDRGNPSHDTDPRLGTPDDLRDAIAQIQAMGVKVILFSKFTWADRSQAWFRDELIRYASKDPYGDYHVYGGYRYQTPTQLTDLNTRRLVPMCHNSAQWREIANAEFRKMLDLGAAGTLYDESQHHGGAIYCFDPDHGHRVPEHLFSGDAVLAEGFRDIVRREAPEFLLAGEACFDLQYRHYSVSYFRIENPGHLAVQRYMDPQAGIMVGVAGFNDRNTLNQCLMYRYIASYEPLNFKGRLDDFPRTLRYGKQIDLLRRRYREFLWDGEFRDTQGMRVITDDSSTTVYTVFRHAASDRHAVVVTNFHSEDSVDVTVKPEAASRDLCLVTPEDPEPRPVKGSITLPPQSVGVVMEA